MGALRCHWLGAESGQMPQLLAVRCNLSDFCPQLGGTLYQRCVPILWMTSISAQQEARCFNTALNAFCDIGPIRSIMLAVSFLQAPTRDCFAWCVIDRRSLHQRLTPNWFFDLIYPKSMSIKMPLWLVDFENACLRFWRGICKKCWCNLSKKEGRWMEAIMQHNFPRHSFYIVLRD